MRQLIRYELRKTFGHWTMLIALALLIGVSLLQGISSANTFYYDYETSGTDMHMNNTKERRDELKALFHSYPQTLTEKEAAARCGDLLQKYGADQGDQGDFAGLSYDEKNPEEAKLMPVVKAYNAFQDRKLTIQENQEFVNDIAYSRLEKGSAQIKIDNIKALPDSISIGYPGGWARFLDSFLMPALISSLAVIAVLAGVYSREYATGVDSFILSSKNGRGKAVWAKLIVSGLVAVLLPLISIGTSALYYQLAFGLEDIHMSVEFVEGASYVAIGVGQTVLQRGLMLTGLTVLSSLFVAGITLLISSLVRNHIVSIFVAGAAAIVPVLLPEAIQATGIFECFLPLAIVMRMGMGFSMENFKLVFGRVVDDTWICVVAALLFAVVLPVLSRAIFKRHQVKG